MPNLYSGPVTPGKTVEVQLYPSSIEIWSDGKGWPGMVAATGTSSRCLTWSAILDVFERKPGAFCGSKPLASWREKDFGQELMTAVSGNGESASHAGGTRQMIQALGLVQHYGNENPRVAAETGMELGCRDTGAIRHLVCSAELLRRTGISLEVPELSRFERRFLPTTDYYLLLIGENTQ